MYGGNNGREANVRRHGGLEREAIGDFIGTQLEEAYARRLGATRTGHRSGADYAGFDLFLQCAGGRVGFQVKSDIRKAFVFVLKASSAADYIPLLIGDPGMDSREKILQEIVTNGVYFGPLVAEDTRQADIDTLRHMVQELRRSKPVVVSGPCTVTELDVTRIPGAPAKVLRRRAIPNATHASA